LCFGATIPLQIGVPILEKAISTTQIPDISSDVKTPVGKVSFSLTSIHASDCTLGTNSIASSPTGLAFAIQDGSIKMSGNWK
jgi:hypothetical protein